LWRAAGAVSPLITDRGPRRRPKEEWSGTARIILTYPLHDGTADQSASHTTSQSNVQTTRSKVAPQVAQLKLISEVPHRLPPRQHPLASTATEQLPVPGKSASTSMLSTFDPGSVTTATVTPPATRATKSGTSRSCVHSTSGRLPRAMLVNVFLREHDTELHEEAVGELMQLSSRKVGAALSH
jgi:hypothetical protein